MFPLPSREPQGGGGYPQRAEQGGNSDSDMTVTFRCQLDWAEGRLPRQLVKDGLGVSVRVLLEEISIWISRWSKEERDRETETKKERDKKTGDRDSDENPLPSQDVARALISAGGNHPIH